MAIARSVDKSINQSIYSKINTILSKARFIGSLLIQQIKSELY